MLFFQGFASISSGSLFFFYKILDLVLKFYISHFLNSICKFLGIIYVKDYIQQHILSCGVKIRRFLFDFFPYRSTRMGEDLQTKYHSYYDWRILGYVDLSFCAIIIISNTLVILVLARQKMSSMDFVFTHISIIESLAALAYVPHVWHELIQATLCSIPQHRTFEWEKISSLSYAAAILFHTIRIWLSVMLALWRYIAISHPLKMRTWCNLKITRILVITGYIFSLVMTIPPYFSMNVGKVERLLDQNGCLTTDSTIGRNTIVHEFQIPLENHNFWYTVVMLGYGIFLKIVPSLVLAAIICK